MPPKARKAAGRAKKKGQKGKGARPRGGLGAMAASRLDAGALAYRQLLVDPCNARFASPAFSGLGSGNFVRRRVIVPAEGSSVEGLYVFQLGTGAFLKGSHVAGTAGTPFTMNSVPLWQSPTLNARCVAGCVKVRYIGPESSRSGLISTLAAPSLLHTAGFVTTALDAAATCPFTHRTGEVAHEVKFVPNEADEEFSLPGTLSPQKTSIAIAYRGVPAQTIIFEITAVLEVESQVAEGATVINSVVPSTGNTLNQVLRSLGPITSWAYSNMVVPTIRATASRIAATALNTSAAASYSMAALTL